MCGRFTQRSNLNVVAAQFQAQMPFPEDWPAPRYNIAPTQLVPIVRRAAEGSARELALVRWGLIPSWAKDAKIGNQTINARAETAAEKPAFRAAFKRRRCLVVADGFYEWHKGGKVKQPYFIRRQDDAPFAFAGLWETWRGDGHSSPLPGSPGKGVGGEGILETCTILTTTANDLMRPLHDRMPVILHPTDFDLWLDPGLADRERLEPLLLPYEGDEFLATPVSTHVNNVRNDDAGCLAEL